MGSKKLNFNFFRKKVDKKEEKKEGEPPFKDTPWRCIINSNKHIFAYWENLDEELVKPYIHCAICNMSGELEYEV